MALIALMEHRVHKQLFAKFHGFILYSILHYDSIKWYDYFLFECYSANECIVQSKLSSRRKGFKAVPSKIVGRLDFWGRYPLWLLFLDLPPSAIFFLPPSFVYWNKQNIPTPEGPLPPGEFDWTPNVPASTLWFQTPHNLKWNSPYHNLKFWHVFCFVCLFSLFISPVQLVSCYSSWFIHLFC